MKKLLLLLVLLGSVGYGQSPTGTTYIRMKKLSASPALSTSTNKVDLFWKESATPGDTGFFRRFSDGSEKRIDSTAGASFKIRAAGSAYRTDSITIKGTAGTLVTQSNDTITVNADSVRKSFVSDSLFNTRQYVWKRTATGFADLVNPSDSLWVGGTTGYNAFLPSGKWNIGLRNNSGLYGIVYHGDSGTVDLGFRIGRMQNNVRWLERSLSASSSFQFAIINSDGSIPYYTLQTTAGMGIKVTPVNILDVGGNMSVTTGTPPSMTGTNNLYVSGHGSFAFANTNAANIAEGIAVAFPINGTDGARYASEYGTNAASEKMFEKMEGVTTTTTATPSSVTLRSVAQASDSTATIMVEANVVAYRSGGGTPANRGQASYKLVGTFGFENGVVIQLGSTTVVHSAESDAALDCSISASTTNIVVTYTGIMGETWRWYCYSTRWYAGHLTE